MSFHDEQPVDRAARLTRCLKRIRKAHDRLQAIVDQNASSPVSQDDATAMTRRILGIQQAQLVWMQESDRLTNVLLSDYAYLQGQIAAIEEANRADDDPYGLFNPSDD
jgi:hypothetical protein